MLATHQTYSALSAMTAAFIFMTEQRVIYSNHIVRCQPRSMLRQNYLSLKLRSGVTSSSCWHRVLEELPFYILTTDWTFVCGPS